jgi:hypothetical protein
LSEGGIFGGVRGFLRGQENKQQQEQATAEQATAEQATAKANTGVLRFAQDDRWRMGGGVTWKMEIGLGVWMTVWDDLLRSVYGG